MDNGTQLPETVNQLQLQISKGQIITEEQQLVLKKLAEFKVIDDATNTEASVWLAKDKKFISLLDNTRKMINLPAEEAIKKNDNWFRPIISMAKNTRDALDGQITGYFMKKRREAEVLQAKLNAQAERQFEKQIEKGQVPAVPEPVAKLAEKPETTLKTDESTTSIKMNYKWHWARPGVSDVKATSKLPDNCWIPNEELITNTVKSLKKQDMINNIFGGEVIVDEVPATASRLKI